MSQENNLSELQFLYLTTTGRKTGLAREIEIWFVEIAGRFYILAEHFHKARWVMNVTNDSRVRVRIGKREFEATARVLSQEGDSELWQKAQQLSRDKYGWGDGLPVEITPDDSK